MNGHVKFDVWHMILVWFQNVTFKYEWNVAGTIFALATKWTDRQERILNMKFMSFWFTFVSSLVKINRKYGADMTSGSIVEPIDGQADIVIHIDPLRLLVHLSTNCCLSIYVRELTNLFNLVFWLDDFLWLLG